MKKTDIVIVGVGGQGTLLASRILGAFAAKEGMDVKVSEVHGMSQRGGSVLTYFRMGEDIAAPLVENGCADYVLAFERLEAARALPFLKKEGGTLIASTQMISPMPVVTGAAVYPENILDGIENKCRLIAFDASLLAAEAGESRAVNLVLLGVLSVCLGGETSLWEDVVRECVPAKALASNLRAFQLGRERFSRPQSL